MFAAVRLRAGWLAVGTALGLAGCAAMPTLPQIDLAMPTLPGFGPPPISAAMEPVPLGPVAESRVRRAAGVRICGAGWRVQCEARLLRAVEARHDRHDAPATGRHIDAASEISGERDAQRRRRNDDAGIVRHGRWAPGRCEARAIIGIGGARQRNAGMGADGEVRAG